MNTNLSEANTRADARRANRAMLWFTGLLGLTTGIGIIAWGAWSLLVTIALSIYERGGLTVDQVVVEDALNQGMLQSAMLIALGVVILELRRIADILGETGDQD